MRDMTHIVVKVPFLTFTTPHNTSHILKLSTLTCMTHRAEHAPPWRRLKLKREAATFFLFCPHNHCQHSDFVTPCHVIVWTTRFVLSKRHLTCILLTLQMCWHKFLPCSQVLTELKSDNQRLKDENGALIRVISKLSKWKDVLPSCLVLVDTLTLTWHCGWAMMSQVLCYTLSIGLLKREREKIQFLLGLLNIQREFYKSFFFHGNHSVRCRIVIAISTWCITIC